MICSRCGLCCINLDIFIINPRSIRSDGTLDPGEPEAMIRKPAGERCTHLAFTGEVALCAIHDLPCYRGTPCDRFETIGPADGPCTIRGYLQSLGVEGREVPFHPQAAIPHSTPLIRLHP